MKKVLALAALLVLAAAPAMASSVVNSAHNMNNYGSLTNASGEVCVFCHTPHAADTTNLNAPLWNRSIATVQLFYNSATIEAQTRPSVVSAEVNNSDATLCLTCHDGDAVTSGLNNEPNAGITSWAGFAWSVDGNRLQANIGGGNTALAGDRAGDLSNDHPIGMDYDAVSLADGAFQTTATVENTLTLYDTTSGATNIMWCSTCHDVHDDAYSPFLATSNAASALCVTCHIK